MTSTARPSPEVVVRSLDAMRRNDLTAVEAALEARRRLARAPAGAACHDREQVLDMLRPDQLHEGSQSTGASEVIAGDGAVVLGVRSPPKPPAPIPGARELRMPRSLPESLDGWARSRGGVELARDRHVARRHSLLDEQASASEEQHAARATR